MKEIQLTQGKFAIVDDDDFELLSKLKWYLADGYAQRNSKKTNGKTSPIKMHRQILGLFKGDGKYVDHVDENTLNNTRCNIRIATNSQNTLNKSMRKNNTSGFKCVHFEKDRGLWCATIRINGKQKRIGRFLNPESAYNAYCQAAIKYHGEFANLGHGCVILGDSNANR